MKRDLASLAVADSGLGRRISGALSQTYPAGAFLPFGSWQVR